MVQSLRDEIYSDRPEQSGTGGGAGRQTQDKEFVEREKYAEENFVRLVDTKRIKSKRKRQDDITRFNDFDDLRDFDARGIARMAEGGSAFDNGGEKKAKKAKGDKGGKGSKKKKKGTKSKKFAGRRRN